MLEVIATVVLRCYNIEKKEELYFANLLCFDSPEIDRGMEWLGLGPSPEKMPSKKWQWNVEYETKRDSIWSQGQSD